MKIKATKQIRIKRVNNRFKSFNFAFTSGTGEIFETTDRTISDMSELKEGMYLKLDDGKPIQNGTYILPDGKTYVQIFDGKILKIKIKE